MSRTADAELRQRVRELLQAIEPPAAPLEAIIGRGRGIRLRHAATVLGGVALAGIIAAVTLTTPATAPREPALPVPLPATEAAGSGGAFASGVAYGRAWRLAVQDIAGSGYRCVPAITLDGTDADPVYPDPGNGADIALGPAAPGLGFAFIQLPSYVQGVVLDGQESLPATTVTGCGRRYRIVGFAYRLAHQPRITVVSGPGSPRPQRTAGGDSGDWPVVSQLPPIVTGPPATSQADGMWTNTGSASAETASGLLASGRLWSITLMLGAGGDCYAFTAAGAQMGTCGPISTPEGPETIMALPLAYPPGPHNAATGYAVQVSPATAHLRATASDGSTQLVTPRVVDGRRYAAFVIGSPRRLTRLTWLDATGRVIASTTALPPYGYTQFQPARL